MPEERPGTTRKRANDFCREILPAVSRTFALSIRLLPGDLGASVRCAYLLCRIADTIEDEPELPAPAKASMLDLLSTCFDEPRSIAELVARAGSLTGDAAHLRLARNADLVFETYRDLPQRTRGIVRRWTHEMIAGMRKFVLAYPKGVRIQSLDEYKEYCYYVAGTVGYLLTDLWHEHSSSIGAHRHAILREHCRAFAEALQTVNILKDVVRDAQHENSIYVPEQLLRAHGSAHSSILASEHSIETHAALGALTQIAWRDLDQAKRYLLAIPRRAVPIRLFCALPLLFAYATLRDLTRLPNQLGLSTAKISRKEVKSLTLMTVLAVLSNRAMSRLVERARTKPLVLGF